MPAGDAGGLVLPRPSISMTVTAAPFSFSGGMAPAPAANGSASPYGQGQYSRPPHQPAASVAQSGSPFNGGPAGYTTRPPWMADDSTAPLPMPGGDGAVPPMSIFSGQAGAGTASPYGSVAPMPMPAVAPAGVGGAAGSTSDADAWYAKGSRSDRSSERGILTRLFILVMKLVPIALVLGASYYGYQSFFGPVSAEERARYLASPVAAAAHGGDTSKVPTSRVGLMLQQAKDSVAAHDQNVHVANAIAEDPSNLDAISDAGLGAPVAAPKPPPELKVKLDLSGAQLMLGQSAGEDMVAGAGVNMATAATIGMPAEQANGPAPSPEFRSWVTGVQIAGVRPGDNARTFLNGRMARPGDIVDYKLGIMLERVEEADRVLVFRDRSGATIGKRY